MYFSISKNWVTPVIGFIHIEIYTEIKILYICCCFFPVNGFEFSFITSIGT